MHIHWPSILALTRLFKQISIIYIVPLCQFFASCVSPILSSPWSNVWMESYFSNLAIARAFPLYNTIHNQFNTIQPPPLLRENSHHMTFLQVTIIKCPFSVARCRAETSCEVLALISARRRSNESVALRFPSAQAKCKALKPVVVLASWNWPCPAFGECQQGLQFDEKGHFWGDYYDQESCCGSNMFVSYLKYCNIHCNRFVFVASWHLKTNLYQNSRD